MSAKPVEREDVWKALAAPLPPDAINWRQDGRPVSRDGKHFSRFVAYIDAQFVQQRFDDIVPGEWDSSLEPLPNVVSMDGEEDREPYAFKCKIQVLGVIREDVGQGKDYKTAATDAFKRAAVRFGIGRELYAMHPNFVPMDGEGKYARPIEDPAVAYAKRYGNRAATPQQQTGARVAAHIEPPHEVRYDGSGRDDHPATDTAPAGPLASAEPSCPSCGGRMYDNRLTKRNPKAPDFKCRDRSCEGVVWPPRQTA